MNLDTTNNFQVVDIPSHPDHNTVTLFEQKIAEFFGAPYAVATDSCTSALELSLRFVKAGRILCPKRTYLSVPILANKLGIDLQWDDRDWIDYYYITPFAIYRIRLCAFRFSIKSIYQLVG